MRNRLYAVIPILLFVLSISAFADSAADLKRGTDLIAARKYDDAIKVLSGVEKADPALGQQSNQLLGDCYRLKSDYATAITYYQTARTKYTISADLDKQIRRSMMDCHIQLRQWPEVEKDIAELSASFPANAGYWNYSLAKHYCMSGMFPKASDAAQKSVATLTQYPKDPNAVNYNAVLAWAYIGLRDYAKADALVTDMSKGYPDSPAVWHLVQGAIYQAQGKKPEAVGEIRTALSFPSPLRRGVGGEVDIWWTTKLLGDLAKPLTPATEEPLGDCYRLLGDYANAIKYYEPLAPNNPSADLLEHLGDCYRLLGDNEKAIPCYQSVRLKKDVPAGQSLRAGHWLINCQIQTRQWADVEKNVAALSGSFPQYAAYWQDSLARHYCMSGMSDKGVTAAQAAVATLEKNPKDPNGVNYKSALVWSYINANKLTEAGALIAQMTKDYPKQPAAWRFLNGAVLERQGKPREALAEIDYALGPHPGFVDAWWANNLLGKIQAAIPKPDLSTWESLGDCHRLLGNNAKAIECYLATRNSRNLTEEQAKRVHAQLVQLHIEQGNWGEAQSEGLLTDVVAELQKQFAAAHAAKDGASQYTIKLQLLSCYETSDDWVHAIPLCEGLVKEHPDIIALKARLMHAYLDGKQYEKGIPVCKEVLAKDENRCVDALTVYAECMHPLGNGKEAIAFQDEYFRQHAGRKFEADFTRARTAYYAERDWSKAAMLLENLIASFPHCPAEVNSMLINAYAFSGQPEKAGDALDAVAKGAALARRNDLLMRKADIYYSARKYREATGFYKAALTAQGAAPDYVAKALYEVALCYRRSGLTRTAKMYMQRVSEGYSGTAWASKARGMLYAWGVLEQSKS